MGAYKYMRETYQKELKEGSPLMKARLIQWRTEPTVRRAERPTNLARARTLGYKAKDGYIIVRVTIDKGRRRRPTPMKGRKPAHQYLFVQPGLSTRAQAEQKANRKYMNMEVLNSYFIGEDGMHKFFEIILVDPKRTGLDLLKKRAFRGLTSAGVKVRGWRSWGKSKPRRRSKKKERKEK